jgi:hypothetical protein
MSKPRAYTAKEMQEIFIEQVRGIAKYWAELPNREPKERCDGVAFSILTLIDGHSCGHPPIDMHAAPHPTDEEYHKQNGENWYDPEVLMNDCYLHDMFYKKSN